MGIYLYQIASDPSSRTHYGVRRECCVRNLLDQTSPPTNGGKMGAQSRNLVVDDAHVADPAIRVLVFAIHFDEMVAD